MQQSPRELAAFGRLALASSVGIAIDGIYTIQEPTDGDEIRFFLGLAYPLRNRAAQIIFYVQ
jgi:hypothetical protein